LISLRMIDVISSDLIAIGYFLSVISVA
jgi:hypothetical protein